jgi:glutaredoxin
MPAKTATLYRMVTNEHICPFGLKSKDLLEHEGFTVDDRPLTSREETDRFMKRNGVETTPQTFIAGERVGGYDDLQECFGIETTGGGDTSYRPIVAVFAVAALMALAASWVAFGTLTLRTLEWFIAFSMCVLAIQKLQDLESFSNRFITYDLLSMRWVRYAYVYPFGEALAGVLMIAGALPWIASPVALFIGAVGAVSVFKAVYIDRRELKCACVGGGSNVPLGFISLTENLMMVAMGAWMLVK